MGTLRSNFNHSGMDVGGLTLGEPARDVDKDNEPVGEYRWDDSRLPNGEIGIDGTITQDEMELM
jgi:hypothetical protein